MQDLLRELTPQVVGSVARRYRDFAAAEDAVQEAYVRAFTHLDSFRGDSSLSTWLCRITINEAVGRLRARTSTVDLTAIEARRDMAEIIPFPITDKAADATTEAIRARMMTAFIRSTQYEWLFWDGAYQQRDWPAL